MIRRYIHGASRVRLIIYIAVFILIIAKMPAVQTAMTDSTPTNSQPIVLLGKDGDWWDWAMLFSLGLAALAAFVVAATTYAQVEVHKRESMVAKQELARGKAEVEGKVAEARAEGIKAGRNAADALVKVAEANKQAAVAIAQAASANEAAEMLRAKNLDLEAATAPRILEQNLTAQALSAFKGTPVAVFSPNDFEMKRAGGQIRAMLAQAGWEISRNPPMRENAYFDGVVVHNGFSGMQDRSYNQSAIDTLVRVLNDNGIVTRSGYPMPEEGRIVVLVGPKPLPTALQLRPENVPADDRGNRIYGNILE